jgi:hypothetical protein
VVSIWYSSPRSAGLVTLTADPLSADRAGLWGAPAACLVSSSEALRPPRRSGYPPA